MVALNEDFRREEHSRLTPTRSIDTNCLFDDDDYSLDSSVNKKARVLIIGSSETSITSSLEEQDYEVKTITNGFDALAKAPGYKPDLIISEIIMPGIDGLVVCESLKQLPEFEHVPFIFLTGRADKNSVVRGLHAGASDYITKPFDRQEALARIQNHLTIRKLTLEKEENNRILNEKNEALRKANEYKVKLLGVATHDLKGPISAINGIAHFLSDGTLGKLTPEQKEAVGQIISACGGMHALAEDLLNISNVERNHIVLDKKEHNIAKVIEEITQLCVFSAAQKGITMRFESADVNDTIALDEMQVKRVLQNFISNAIKFSSSGTEITVRLQREYDHVVVRVEDEGPGVPAEEQSKLFTEYGQTSVKPTGDEVSTGLGLNICRKLVEAHGGSIGMENLEPKGACFFFTLPLQ